MTATAFGHLLETLHDGMTVLRDGLPAPTPLRATRIDVEIQRGLATLRTTRVFRNDEDRPIEAILTMPLGFDTVVTGMVARLDGRVLRAEAKPKAAAREDYEAGLDAGKTSLLHEEVLCGVHMLSVGQIGPGAELEVELEALCALSGGDAPFLRIPVTVGQLYGASPLAPADDLVTSAQVRHVAELTVRADSGAVRLNGARMLESGEMVTVPLDAAIEISVPQGVFGTHEGWDADGRQVRLELRTMPAGDAALDLAVLVDRSGSTGSSATRDGSVSVWEAMRTGLDKALGGLRAEDCLSLWQFDDRCQHLGQAKGAELGHLTQLLESPRGGTRLGGAVTRVLQSGARDILILTDGQTWSSDVDGMLSASARISAILVGPGSLDANIGRICAQTGGQLFYAPGEDVATALVAALAALRRAAGPVSGMLDGQQPQRAEATRGGIGISATWRAAPDAAAPDVVGRFAAALALPLLSGEGFDDWATAHGLCTHRTSLILVDDAGERHEGLAQMRKIPLSAAPVPEAMAMMRPASMARMAAPFIRRPLGETPPAAPTMDWMEAEQDRVVPRFLRRMAKKTRLDPEGLFHGFDWLRHGDALLGGDLSMLTVEQLATVGQAMEAARVVTLAGDHGLNREPVALALIALETASQRVAQRFAAKVFAGVPREVWAGG